jgi:hypothetical protein
LAKANPALPVGWELKSQLDALLLMALVVRVLRLSPELSIPKRNLAKFLVLLGTSGKHMGTLRNKLKMS